MSGGALPQHPMQARPFPEGWFRLCASREVSPGDVRVVRLNGRERVLFRTRAGRLGLLDKVCPHLGAHLGRGGKVVGESLRCPFHGFRFDVDGQCTGSEYPGDPRVRAPVDASKVVDWHEQIVAYDSHDGSAPDWQLPQLEDAPYGRARWIHLSLRGHVQDVAENGVDLGHFGAVHGYSNVSDTSIRFDGRVLHSRFAFDRDSPLLPRLGKVRSVFDTDIHGLGCSVTRLHVQSLGLRCRLLSMATQLDAEQLEFHIGVQWARPASLRGTALKGAIVAALEPALLSLLCRKIEHDVLQDREIWAHRSVLARPSLVAGDGPLSAFQRYAAQFYPAHTPRRARGDGQGVEKREGAS